MLESIKIKLTYSINGKIKTKLQTTENSNDNITNKTKKAGNQYVSFDVAGCQLFKIGLTIPNFLTCI